MNWSSTSRVAPRITLDTFCSLLVDGRERHAVVLELSASGVRVERPFEPAREGRIVQLELELPGIDEIIWARGEVRFARLSPLPGPGPEGAPRFTCRAGIHIAAATQHDRRLLRDYVIEQRRRQRAGAAARRHLPRCA